MEEIHIEKFALPSEIRRSLGDIVIAWARVEALIAEFLSFLLQANPGSMYVLNQDIASGTQMKWIKILMPGRFSNENTQKGLSILFERIDTARSERNAYIHGVWSLGPTDDSATVQTIKLDRAETVKTELVTVTDLNNLFSDIESVSDELFVVLRKLDMV